MKFVVLFPLLQVQDGSVKADGYVIHLNVSTSVFFECDARNGLLTGPHQERSKRERQADNQTQYQEQGSGLQSDLDRSDGVDN